PETAAATTPSVLRSLLGRFVRAFLTDLFLDLAPPFAREPRAQKPVKQIREEENGRHPFVIHHCDCQDDDDDKETRDGFGSFPIDRFEARILEPAEHHKRKKKEQWGQHKTPVSKTVFPFGQPKQK